jgi:hypothetical protein
MISSPSEKRSKVYMRFKVRGFEGIFNGVY